MKFKNLINFFMASVVLSSVICTAQAVTVNKDGHESLLRSMKHDYYLVFFSATSCPACGLQRQVLLDFQKNFNWNIKELDFLANKNIVKRLGIHSIPTIILIRNNPAHWIAVTSGAKSLSVLEKALMNALSVMQTGLQKNTHNN